MTFQLKPTEFATANAQRAFVLLYHGGQTNHCPGCGGTHWHIGRTIAECARCETALPIALYPGGEHDDTLERCA